MAKHRSYWTYSIGCLAVWVVLLTVSTAKGRNDTRHHAFLVFGGWALCWVSTTIARFVYPPPNRWLRADAPTT